MNLSGVGIGLRRTFARELLRTERHVDWLEIIPENFVHATGPAFATLEACRERWPLAFHSVSLSVCGAGDFEPFARALGRLVERVKPALVSDHLCISEIRGEPLFDLLPVPHSEPFALHALARAKVAEEIIGAPLSLENVTNYAPMPGGTMNEPAFVRRVIEGAGVGLLLDLNNLYLNATNFGLDPHALLDAMPLRRVTQIHLAGHVSDGTRLLDTHSRPVADAVWALYRHALRQTGPVPVLIEWDQEIPSLNAVLDEADRARAILHQETAQALSA